VTSRSGALLAGLSLAIGSLLLAAEAKAPKPPTARATFAGGCFWCMEPPFEKIPGVASVTSGYTGGQKVNPSYEEVSAGGTGHAESVDIVYDPAKVTYAQLLDVFWHNVDPTQGDGQFCDHGHQYRTAIFYHDAEQKRLAEESREKVQARLQKPVVTEIVAASRFYPAEEYHQDFWKKSPARYNAYRAGCGRDARLKQIWGEAAGGHK
jgi:peptide-methionine (S)-S-oxide reductase